MYSTIYLRYIDEWMVKRYKYLTLKFYKLWRLRVLQRKRAIRKIELAWVEYIYRPGNIGFLRAYKNYCFTAHAPDAISL